MAGGARRVWPASRVPRRFWRVGSRDGKVGGRGHSSIPPLPAAFIHQTFSFPPFLPLTFIYSWVGALNHPTPSFILTPVQWRSLTGVGVAK